MAFDICQHQINQVIIRAGAAFRKIKGLPEEKNISILLNEAASLLGIPPQLMSSSESDHLPSPGEMKSELGNFIVPRKPCSKCKGEMVLGPICPSCKDAEGGKYKSGYKCEVCQFIDDKSEMFFAQRLSSLGVEIPEGPKQALGIKTLTDKGLE
jgi:hypothetical protein